MEDEKKTREQSIEELKELRQCVAEKESFEMEACQVAEGEYRSIFEKAGEGIFQTTANGRFLNANPALARLLGYESPEDLMVSVTDIGRQLYVSPEKREEHLRLVNENGSVRGFEIQVYRKDGSICVLSISYRLVRNNGNPVYYEGLVIDITERKRMEEELTKQHRHLETLVKEQTGELETKSRMLEETNIALKVLLQRRDVERQNLEDRFITNIKILILPYLEKMKSNGLDTRLNAYVRIMESNLNELMSSLIHNMRQHNFTPKEIMVASLVRDGRTTKEIAEVICVGTSAIDSHRNRIRKKLGLSKRKTNLQAYLHSLK